MTDEIRKALEAFRDLLAMDEDNEAGRVQAALDTYDALLAAHARELREARAEALEKAAGLADARNLRLLHSGQLRAMAAAHREGGDDG